MKARRGQVALYLIAILVAICVLTIMNVGIFLSVTAKNHAMNAGDAAAIAVATYQGELLNRIGQLNIKHLLAAIENDEEACESIMTEQLRMSFLGPISGADGESPQHKHKNGGISAGNDAAKANGAERNEALEQLLRDHIIDIRQHYATTPDLYPAPWEGAWEEYAQALEVAVNQGLWAGPDNINFIDANGEHLLLNPSFYDAVAGSRWCWLKFNAQGLLDSYGSYRDWSPLPTASDDARLRRCVNSEIYSLNVWQRIGSAIELLGTNLIISLTGKAVADIEQSYMITNTAQAWMFYDARDTWREWWEIDPESEEGDPFPVVGPVKREYNVRGCAALCRVYVTRQNLLDDEEDEFAWTGGAKPFGTVENEEGEIDVVTANHAFVTPAFTEAHLVPIDAVGGKNLSTGDPAWMTHVRKHLPPYLAGGPASIALFNCYYCRALVKWEKPTYRQMAKQWLKTNGGTCTRPCSGSGRGGGTTHGH